jgi:hypothetical protein
VLTAEQSITLICILVLSALSTPIWDRAKIDHSRLYSDISQGITCPLHEIFCKYNLNICRSQRGCRYCSWCVVEGAYHKEGMELQTSGRKALVSYPGGTRFESRPGHQTNFMELTASWEAANCATTQELPSTIWNPKVHYRAHKSPPLAHILSQINQVHTISSYLSKINCNIVHPYMWLFGYPNRFFVAFLIVPWKFRDSTAIKPLPCLTKILSKT